MKLQHAIVFIVGAILLAACNFTLAADITPPPGYIPPTPMPTLGPLFPAQAPDIENGKAIYVEKCAPCHGDTGLGDGAQGKQLPVTVAAFALPETARKASPAQWYTTVTQGNLDRFMPPFTSLSDQERWNVISYALTLHTTPEQIQKGKTIFETNCADCAAKFQDQKKMAALSDDDLVRVIRNGDDEIPAFGSGLSDEDAYAAAAYARTLTFAPPSPTPEPASVTGAQVPAEAAPLEGTPQAEVQNEAAPAAGFGIVRGSLDNQTGKSLPADLTVTLHGYEHGADPNAGPQEVLTLTAPVEADGSFIFDNVEMPENRIFIAEVNVDGLTLQSDFAVVKNGANDLQLAPIKLYGTTADTSALKIEDVTMFFDFANENNVQVFIVYTFSNTGDKTIAVKMGDKQEIPFIKFPANAKGLGYEAAQDSAKFIPTSDGFAMPPSPTPYGLIAFASLPKDNKIEFSQPFEMAVTSVRILTPEGVKASSDQLTDTGVQQIQSANYQTYSAAHLKAGDTLTFTLSGKPKGAATTISSQQTLLFGAGALGVVLILAGVWLYLRDRKRFEDEEDEEQDEFDSPEDVMDAIIALDDLHRAGKISDEAHRTRRAELKDILKRMA